MKIKVSKFLLFLFFVSLNTVHGQNNDPHSANGSHITGMPSEEIFMVLDITVHDSLQYQKYRLKVESLIEEFGGIYLVRSGGRAYDLHPERKIIPVKGNWNPNRFIIVAWNSMEDFEKFSTSEEYKAVAKLQDNSATTKSIIVKKY